MGGWGGILYWVGWLPPAYPLKNGGKKINERGKNDFEFNWKN